MAFYDVLKLQLEQYAFLGNTGWNYAIALVIFIGIYIALRIFKSIIIGRIKHLAKKTKNNFDDYILGFIDGISWFFLAYIALYFGVKTLSLPSILDSILDAVLLILATFYIVRAIGKVIDVSADHYVKKTHGEEGERESLSLITGTVKLIVYIIAILAILGNMGFNITSIVAGLGIGGLAIALALQNVLADIFASFSIFFDKPFRVGDFIVVGDKMGNVLRIGIKTTRVKALQGEEIVFSNQELTSAQIRNFKKMEKRRVVFGFGVTYDTPVAKMEKIPVMVEDIIKKEKNTELDRVNFKDFGDSSLNFEVAYFIDLSDYNEYMHIQEKLNLAIMKKFEKEKIDFAFPTRTIILQK